jgi:hypothetical protein
MSEGVAEAPHLAPAALAQLELQPRLGGAGLEHAHTACRRAPVLEPDASAHPQQRVGRRRALDLHVVDAGDAVAGVLEAGRELSVVGEEHQAGALEIEAADGIDAFTRVRDQLRNRRPPLRVAQRGHDAAGLVECDGAWRTHPHALPVDGDLVVRGIGALPERRHDPAIHAHTARPDQRFGGAP